MELSSSLSRGWSKLAPVTLVALLQRDTTMGGDAGEVKWRNDVGDGEKEEEKKEAARAAGERRIGEGRRREDHLYFLFSFFFIRARNVLCEQIESRWWPP